MSHPLEANDKCILPWFPFNRKLRASQFFHKLFFKGFFFLKELQYSLIDPILDNILEIPIRITAMILGIVILTVYFSPKLYFVRELVILGKCDEFLLQ